MKDLMKKPLVLLLAVTMLLVSIPVIGYSKSETANRSLGNTDQATPTEPGTDDVTPTEPGTDDVTPTNPVTDPVAPTTDPATDPAIPTDPAVPTEPDTEPSVCDPSVSVTVKERKENSVVYSVRLKNCVSMTTASITVIYDASRYSVPSADEKTADVIKFNKLYESECKNLINNTKVGTIIYGLIFANELYTNEECREKAKGDPGFDTENFEIFTFELKEDSSAGCAPQVFTISGEVNMHSYENRIATDFSFPAPASANHTPGTPVEKNIKDATCTENGSYTEIIVCTECGTEISAEEKVIPAKGHTEVIDAAKDATCTEGGLTEGKHCSVCGTVLTAQETVPAKGHKWGEWNTVKNPTETAEGVEERVCSVCGDKETRAVAKLPYAEIVINEKTENVDERNGFVATVPGADFTKMVKTAGGDTVVLSNEGKILDTAKEFKLGTGMRIAVMSGDAVVKEITVVVMGDVNGDGDISVSDARNALRAAVGLDKIEGAFKTAAIINPNKENAVGVSDARSILRAAVELDSPEIWFENK